MVCFRAACESGRASRTVCSYSRGRYTVIHTLSPPCLKKARCGLWTETMCEGALVWLLPRRHKPSEEELSED